MDNEVILILDSYITYMFSVFTYGSTPFLRLSFYRFRVLSECESEAMIGCFIS